MADAGKYVLLDTLWDERVNPVTETVPVFKRHRQGEVLDLDEAEATRLADAGSIAVEGEREARELEAARNRYRAALAALPDDLRHKLGEVDLDELADREIPVEELSVHHPDARGFTNEGHPKYAAAAHGEGGTGEGSGQGRRRDRYHRGTRRRRRPCLDDGAKTSVVRRGPGRPRRDESRGERLTCEGGVECLT
jgi:hypothetical protein